MWNHVDREWYQIIPYGNLVNTRLQYHIHPMVGNLERPGQIHVGPGCQCSRGCYLRGNLCIQHSGLWDQKAVHRRGMECRSMFAFEYRAGMWNSTEKRLEHLASSCYEHNPVVQLLRCKCFYLLRDLRQIVASCHDKTSQCAAMMRFW